MLGFDPTRLSALPLFSSLSKGDLLMLSQLVEELPVRVGQALTTQGKRGNVFGIFERGTADVFVDGELVTQLGPGDHYGEIALLGGEGVSTADVVATSDGSLVSFRGHDFDELRDEEPRLIEALVGSMHERLQRAAPRT